MNTKTILGVFMENDIKQLRVLAVQSSRQARVLNQSAYPLVSQSSGCTSGSSGTMRTPPGVRIALVVLLLSQLARHQRSRKSSKWFVSVFTTRICSAVLKQYSGRWKILAPDRYRRSGRSIGSLPEMNSPIGEPVNIKPGGRHTPCSRQRCRTRPIKPIWLVRAI